MEKSTLTIKIVTSLEEFSRLADEWRTLLSGTSSDHIFLTWEWLYTWARHYLREERLLILLAVEDGQTVGIAPLYIRKTGEGAMSLKRVEFLGSGEACSSYLDFIVRDDKRKPVLKKFYDYLHGEAKSQWDLLCLAEVPAESPTIDVLYETVGQAGKVIEVLDPTSCPLIKLDGNEEEFLKGISGNERYNLKRKSKRLTELGRVEYLRLSSVDDIQNGMKDFVELHRMRWRQKGNGGSFESRTFLEFHEEVSRVFGRKGWVRLDFLILDWEKVAGIYGYVYNGVYYFYLPGLKPQIFPETSPGILLLYQSVRQAIGEGCKTFDLLRGPADYKMAWANGLRRSVTLMHYNNTVRAAASKLANGAKKIVKVLVR
jgi:CelD/BcsL family acetyltransferase involved in cellulose biosynthesis